jgi:hypothetical protein
MALFRTIANVVSNLSEGKELTAVRPALNAQASDAFKRRLQSLERTERFVESSIKPRVPEELHKAIDRFAAYVEEPITSIEALLSQVRSACVGQGIAVGRADWPETHLEALHAKDLEALAGALQSLVQASASGTEQSALPQP